MIFGWWRGRKAASVPFDAFPAVDDGSTRSASGYCVSPEVIALSELRGDQIEALREVGAQLVAQQVAGGRRGVAICAASPGAGVTFLATNLAVVLAQSGVSTMLIDANLRQPRLQELIEPFEDQPGLQHLLRGEVTDPFDVVHPAVLQNLSLVYSGGVAPDAAELLSTQVFRDFVLGCLRDYDFTIIDTPPANRWADALTISATVGYSLLVARRNASIIEDVGILSKELTVDGTTVIGALLNGA